MYNAIFFVGSGCAGVGIIYITADGMEIFIY